jgi:GTP cyclohydrolase II
MHVPATVIRPQLEITARAQIPTRFGTFDTVVFRWIDAPRNGLGLSDEPIALVAGDVRGKRAVPVRVHSECLTSEVFGSLKCDCKQQLEAAQAELARRGEGAILYLRQEGRGIGLSNKIRAYALQAEGADTVDANRMLGLPDDARKYDVAAAMLRELGIESISLMTNNPDKVEALRGLGVEVESRIPVLVRVNNPHAAGYLEAKRRRMRHVLPARYEEPRAVEGSPLYAPFDAELIARRAVLPVRAFRGGWGAVNAKCRMHSAKCISVGVGPPGFRLCATRTALTRSRQAASLQRHPDQDYGKHHARLTRGSKTRRIPELLPLGFAFCAVHSAFCIRVPRLNDGPDRQGLTSQHELSSAPAASARSLPCSPAASGTARGHRRGRPS